MGDFSLSTLCEGTYLPSDNVPVLRLIAFSQLSPYSIEHCCIHMQFHLICLVSQCISVLANTLDIRMYIHTYVSVQQETIERVDCTKLN